MPCLFMPSNLPGLWGAQEVHFDRGVYTDTPLSKITLVTQCAGACMCKTVRVYSPSTCHVLCLRSTLCLRVGEPTLQSSSTAMTCGGGGCTAMAALLHVHEANRCSIGAAAPPCKLRCCCAIGRCAASGCFCRIYSKRATVVAASALCTLLVFNCAATWWQRSVYNAVRSCIVVVAGVGGCLSLGIRRTSVANRHPSCCRDILVKEPM
jgi:hypothetical protein